MLINITKEFLSKLKMLSDLASSNKNVPYIKWDTTNTLTAIGNIYNLSYKLGQEEAGLMAEHPEETFLLVKDAIKFLLSRQSGEVADINGNNYKIKISISNKKTKSEYVTTNSNEFPTITDPERLNTFAINGTAFSQAIKLTRYAISDNKVKPIYTGLHFISENGQLTIFSCDGYRAARVAIPYQSDKPFTISIPKDTIKFLSSVSFGETMNLSVDDGFRKAIIKLDENTTLRTALLSGEILDHKSLFVKMNQKIIVSKKSFSEAVDNVLLLQGNKTTQVKFTFINNKGYVYLKTDSTSFEDEISVNSSDPKNEFTIAFNPIYLKEAVDNIPEKDDGTITIHYNGSLAPIKINNGVNDIQALVVPMRITTNH